MSGMWKFEPGVRKNNPKGGNNMAESKYTSEELQALASLASVLGEVNKGLNQYKKVLHDTREGVVGSKLNYMSEYFTKAEARIGNAISTLGLLQNNITIKLQNIEHELKEKRGW